MNVDKEIDQIVALALQIALIRNQEREATPPSDPDYRWSVLHRELDDIPRTVDDLVNAMGDWAKADTRMYAERAIRGIREKYEIAILSSESHWGMPLRLRKAWLEAARQEAMVGSRHQGGRQAMVTPGQMRAWSRAIDTSSARPTSADYFVNDKWAYSVMTFYIVQLRDPARTQPDPWPAEDTYENVDAYWRERFDQVLNA